LQAPELLSMISMSSGNRLVIVTTTSFPCKFMFIMCLVTNC